MTTDRMTPDEVAAAARALTPHRPGKGLPPMASRDALDGLAEDVRLALDAELGGRPDHAHRPCHPTCASGSVTRSETGGPADGAAAVLGVDLAGTSGRWRPPGGTSRR